MTERKYLSCADTAKLVRAALKESFPAVKFSVKSHTYSGGASIDIGWTDGPTGEQVEAISNAFSGAYFDGMIDYKGSVYHTLDGAPVRFGADFIFAHRAASDAAVQAAIDAVVALYRCPAVTVEQFRNGDTWRTPVCNNATADSYTRAIRDALASRHEFAHLPLPADAKPSPTMSRVRFQGSDNYGQPYGSRGYVAPAKVQA